MFIILIYNDKKYFYARRFLYMSTPEYTRRAIDNYKNKFDIINVRLPKGTKDRIKKTIKTESINNYIVELVKKDLEQKEKN